MLTRSKESTREWRVVSLAGFADGLQALWIRIRMDWLVEFKITAQKKATWRWRAQARQRWDRWQVYWPSAPIRVANINVVLLT